MLLLSRNCGAFVYIIDKGPFLMCYSLVCLCVDITRWGAFVTSDLLFITKHITSHESVITLCYDSTEKVVRGEIV